MKPLRFLLTFACALAIASSALATTVIPPTFDDLVSRAELIFQGTVTSVRSDWVGKGEQRHIASYITFNVQDAIKGDPGGTYTIEMVGGTVGDQTMKVTDAPDFKVGDRDILFIEHNGQQFIPLVGIMHGRFRLQREQQTGRDIVATDDGRPLSDLTQLGKDEHAAVAANRPSLSPDDFKSAIHASIRDSAGKARAP